MLTHKLKAPVARSMIAVMASTASKFSADTLPSQLEVTHLNLNDRTIEGVRHREVPAFSVQYHPEAAPGPHDSHYLFQDFAEAIAERRS